jgi:hypothetical protein
MELDVMHFIFSEMHLAMLDRKIPPYAPYIMRPILDKGIEGDFEIKEGILFEGVVEHKLYKLYKKTAHLITSTSRAFAPSASSGDLGDNCYASGCRRKNADPPSGGMGQEIKKLKWWKNALFCMNNDVRHTQYDDYVKRKHLWKKQRDLDAQDETEEQVNSEDTFSFGKWNEGASFDWKEFAEVTSKGKEFATC